MKIKRKSFMMHVMAIVVWGLAQTFAHAEPRTWQMLLTHHEFKDWAFSPEPGDTIAILNTSDIAHAIYVTYPDGTVLTLTEHVQLPGTTVEWVIPDAPGDYLLRCWIHPIIKANLTVRTASP